MEPPNWVALAYGLGVACQLLFAAFAMYVGWAFERRTHKQDTETYITARGTSSKWRIGWSWYASAMGAWVIAAPSAYVSSAGVVGIPVYALASASPILMIAAMGSAARRQAPGVLSLSDFALHRFGPVAKLLVCIIAVFHQSIVIIAEFSSLGAVFSAFVGTLDWPIIVTAGAITLTYCAFGGLYVSIVTDMAQGIASVLFWCVLAAVVAATYRHPVPSPLPTEPFDLAPNEKGWTGIFTISAALLGSNFFSEFMWQRVWASESTASMWAGAGLAFGMIAAGIGVSAVGGFLAMAGGLATKDTNVNVILMQLFSRKGEPAVLSNAWGLLVVLLAVIMNEGAIDSLQNGLAASLSSQWLRDKHIIWSRLAVVLINIPLIIVAARGYSVLSLFTVTNIVGACGLLPFAAGFVPALRPWVSESAVLAGYATGAVGVTAAGIGIFGSAPAGADWAWFSNQYDWRAFVAALSCSAGGTALWATASAALRGLWGVEGPGISGVLLRVPGVPVACGVPRDWLERAAAGEAEACGGGAAAAGGGGGGELGVEGAGGLAAGKDASAGGGKRAQVEMQAQV